MNKLIEAYLKDNCHGTQELLDYVIKKDVIHIRFNYVFEDGDREKANMTVNVWEMLSFVYDKTTNIN